MLISTSDLRSLKSCQGKTNRNPPMPGVLTYLGREDEGQRDAGSVPHKGHRFKGSGALCLDCHLCMAEHRTTEVVVEDPKDTTAPARWGQEVRTEVLATENFRYCREACREYPNGTCTGHRVSTRRKVRATDEGPTLTEHQGWIG